ncbi:extracellular solute-binding protein [uncultured Robinsoniella sp.]|uniref:extracellular solute-binding protein n=1 Tax=uncultured Robinsoniella sp. TaxID=904190 RepID=UPI00374F7428
MVVLERIEKIQQPVLTAIFIITLSLLLFLSGCSASDSNKSEDVLTQKAASKGKTQITVLVKYAFTINEFEKAVEKQFPDIDLVQVGNYTRNMGIEEYAARLEHDDIPDIVMTWPLDVGREYWSDRLLDLSGMEFSSRYNTSMLNDISTDGKLYYLPGPAQVRGIVYNKTLFKEKGWEVPKDYEGFLELCKTIEASGIRSIQLGFQNQEVLDTAFVGYNFGNYFSRPQDLEWMDDYNQGIGSFGEQFGGALDVFQQMTDAGVWKASDLEIDYSEREKMLFTRQCAMVEDSSLMAKMGYSQTGTSDEFALMPFFNPGSNNDWARLYMVCYIGLNKHLAEPENKDKYDLVMEIMNYISTVEGQKMLSADTGAMYSSLIDATPPDVPEIEALIPALNQGRYAVFPTLGNAQGALREGLAGMLKGTLTKEDVIRMADEQNLFPPVTESPKLLGEASESFSLTDTGNFVADAMRTWGDCELALYLDNGKDGNYNGKGISGRIYAGDITTSDIDRIMPDLKANDSGALWKASISGEDLLAVLEYSVSVENNQTGWFYYFSGLKMEFDPTAEPGNRVKKITASDGSAIDPARNYTIVVTEESVPEEYLQNCSKTDSLSYDIVTRAVESAGTISPAKDGRFVLYK